MSRDILQLQKAWRDQQRQYLQEHPEHGSLDPEMDLESGPDLDKIAEATKVARAAQQ